MGESDPETAESLNTFGSALLLSGQPEASRLHLDVWIIQQLREAFAHDAIPRYLVFDNDEKYGTDVLAVIVLNERVCLSGPRATPESRRRGTRIGFSRSTIE